MYNSQIKIEKNILFRFLICIIFVCVLGHAQVERWVYRFNGPANHDDEAIALIHSVDGNIYAAGYSSGNSTDSDFTVVSLTPGGGERWVYRYNGPGDSLDIARAIVCDSGGNLYVAGSSYGSNGNADFVIISLAPNGNERWVYRYNGPGNGHDIGASIACGVNGNIYAAGTSFGTSTENDFTVISVDTTGAEKWVYRYDWASGDDGAYAIAYGIDDNLYVAGYNYMFITVKVFTVISIDTAGSERWIYRTQGTGVVDESAYSVVYGHDDDIYAAG